MPVYTAPVRDTQYVLEHIVELGKYDNLPTFTNASSDIVEAILTEGGRFAGEVLAPLNQVGDQEGCTRHADGSVTTPTGFKDAYKQFCEGGWTTLSAPEEYGGQGLPQVLGIRGQRICAVGQPGVRNVSRADRRRDRVAAGQGHRRAEARCTCRRWSRAPGPGTMNLTEPHCGTDLGLIKTKADPNDDGSYAISGTKIFISSGEHDLSENIIHLVLAKIAGAPDNVKGISLFVVPKFLVNEDGSVGERNPVSCGSIEHKMGIHGNSTCVMNYDGAKGWLVGEPEKGLAAMFIMMNAARLGVGMQGLAMGEVAYQNAVMYAKDRKQGRALKPEDRDPEAKADNLFVHPDVRRMLMEGKAFNEGGARADPVGIAAGRPVAQGPDRGGADRGRRPDFGADPGDQGLSDRSRLRDRGQRPAGVRRPRLHPRMGHGAVRPRRAHRPDLRRHQRRAGDGPGRAQAGQGRRARGARLVRRRRRRTLPRPRRRATRRASPNRWKRRSGICRARPCGWRRTA